MDHHSRKILSVFSLALVALASFQGVNTYLSNSGSAVLGDTSDSFTQAYSKRPNFFPCQTSLDCESNFCHQPSQRCLDKNSLPTTPTQTQVLGDTNQPNYLPCTDLTDLYNKYCPKSPATIKIISGQVRCSTFAQTLASFCGQ